ncbi:MAG: hypothetical protein KBF37_10500 [Saprospiraceae bacterium]|jgi:ABC-type transport system involved in cytochrome c biogenesis permease component|nr:hypothetical protein [Saprospiraceae bacterium]MBP9210737.1 hypothetical protein [Saprospiraceae bacterium]MBV6471812.1 hypothetical protein [Saprospiraceae bacterium]
MQFPQLIRKEILAEWRNPSQLGGLLSFLAGVCFLCYFFSGDVHPAQWNLLFWIVYLFLSFFASARMYEEDNIRYRFYTSQLVRPLLLFAAKLGYLWGLLLLLSWVLLNLFSALLPVPGTGGPGWLLLLVLVSAGFACLGCFTSLLSSYGQSRQMLVIVISLPLCFPLLGSAYAASLELLTGGEAWLAKLIPVLAIDLLTLAMATILLPLSWKG